MFYSLLRRCLTQAAGRQRQTSRQKSALRRRFTLPQLEALEDRVTPSATLTVLNSTDHDPGSLRAAVTSAASGDTIKFASSVHLIKLTTGEIEIGKNLNIVGPGADKLTVSGNDASRVFHIDGGKTVSIAKLTIAHGKSSGTIGLDFGFGYGGGGGILNEAGAKLTLDHDTLSDNQAVGSVGFTVVGGGLLNLGTATVVSCQFTHNQASGGGAFDAIGGAAGGAIDNFGGPSGGATLTVVDTCFSNNSAKSAGGNFYFGVGGALENNGGLVGIADFGIPFVPRPSSANLTNCVFADNLATGGSGASGQGGAATNDGAGSVLTLVGCTITGNRALGGGGGDGLATGYSQGQGGGLYNVGGSTLNVIGCEVTNNNAIGGNNAGISDADPYAAGGFGGGILNNYHGIANIYNSVIACNLVQGVQLLLGWDFRSAFDRLKVSETSAPVFSL